MSVPDNQKQLIETGNHHLDNAINLPPISNALLGYGIHSPIAITKGERLICFTNCSLNFTLDAPFIDIEVTKKLSVRLFPKEYMDLSGVEDVGFGGLIQNNLHYLVIKK